MKRKRRALLVATVFAVGVATVPAQAQLFGGNIVFDPKNYTQNVLEAARALQQIDNQLRSLENETQMLLNMRANLIPLNVSQLQTMTAALSQISNLMNQGNGIAFNLNATNSAWNSSYPSSYPPGTPSSTFASSAETRWQEAMAAFRQALQVQSQIVQNVQADSSTLATLVNASQGAAGNLQASQATNQLVALSAKQELQIEALMAAQDRADALEAARDAESEAAAQSEFSVFIGNGEAYTPQ